MEIFMIKDGISLTLKSRRKMKQKIIFFIFVVCVVMSCSRYEKDELLVEMDREFFDKEFSKWSERNIKNYQFTYEYRSLSRPFLGPIKVTIEEGNEPFIEHPYQYVENVIAKNISEVYDLIHYTFEYIEAVTKEGIHNKSKIKSMTLQIEYDAQFHYPKKIVYSIGYDNKGVPPMGGGGYTLEVIDFHPN